MGSRFWKYVRWRACCEARDAVRDHFGPAMTFVLVSLAGLVVVRFLGSEGEWWNDLLGVVIWLAAMAVLFGYLFAVSFFSIPVRMRKSSLAAIHAARTESKAFKKTIAELTDKPERIRFVDLAALAEADFGWTFGNDSYQSTDFVNSLRQAARDGYLIIIEGRQGCMNKPEYMKDFYLLEPILKDHLKDNHFDVPGFFHGTNNYDVSLAECFRDLHVADRDKAIIWLQKDAEAWKGTAEAAAQLEAEVHKRREAEMREQGFEFIGDENSEQGRRAVKRSDTGSDEGA